MSSQPPTNSQPPQRSKESWRLRGVHRAEPHLGEENRIPLIVWIILGGSILVLVIIGVVFALQMATRTPVSPVLPTATAIPLTPTMSATTMSPTPTTLTATPRPTTTSTSPAPTSTKTATLPPPTAAFVRYRVRQGDTLSSLAETYRVSVRSIMQANGLRNETIYVGQELIIPRPTPHP